MSKDNAEAYLRDVTWDEEAEAIYVTVRKKKIAQTTTLECSRINNAIINADIDKDGNLVGVEIIL